MITDYGTLKDWLASRINRSDLASVTPQAIRSAHDIIVGEMVLAADLTISGQSTAVPVGFREALSVWLVNRPMIQLSEASEEMTQYISGTGVPYCFRIATTLNVYPTPMKPYIARMVYRVSRTFFDVDADTNAILTRYPMVYAWLSLSELFGHTMDDSRSAQYLAKGMGELGRAMSVEVGDATRGALQMTSTAP